MNKEDNIKENVYINKIQTPALKEFVCKSLDKYGKVEQMCVATSITDIVWQKMEYANLVSEHSHQQFADITIAACMLHNLFFKENDLCTLFTHRIKLQELSEECQLDERIVSYIYETMEGQLGGKHPIQKLMPAANTPGSYLAEAIWQAKVFKSRV